MSVPEKILRNPAQADIMTLIGVPRFVAKMAAQLDIISQGRLLLGFGAGWQGNEHEAYGIPFYTTRERLERLDEGVSGDSFVVDAGCTRAKFTGCLLSRNRSPSYDGRPRLKINSSRRPVHSISIRQIRPYALVEPCQVDFLE